MIFLSQVLIAPPILLLFGALALGLMPKRLREMGSLFLPLLALLHLWLLSPMWSAVATTWGELSIQWFTLKSYSLLAATSFLLILWILNLALYRSLSTFQCVLTQLYAASALGVVLAGDMLSLFVFWEVMAWSGVLLLWAGAKGEEGYKAGMRYAMAHAVSGIALLLALVMHYLMNNTLRIEPTDLLRFVSWQTLSYSSALAALLFLASVIINCALWPFSFWMIDGYSNTSSRVMAYLASFTTKASLITLLYYFAGQPILIYLGIATILYGVIYGFFEKQPRSLLLYSMAMMQGLMAIGVGLGGKEAALAVLLLLLHHQLYQTLWMLGMVFEGKWKKLHMQWYVVTASLVMLIPFSLGYIGKTLLHHLLSQHFSLALWVHVLIYGVSGFMAAWMVGKIGSSWWNTTFPHAKAKIPKEIAAIMGGVMLLMIAISIALPWFFDATSSIAFSIASGSWMGMLCYGAVVGGMTAMFWIASPFLQKTTFLLPDIDWLWRKGIIKLLLVFIKKLQNLSGLVIVSQMAVRNKYKYFENQLVRLSSLAPVLQVMLFFLVLASIGTLLYPL